MLLQAYLNVANRDYYNVQVSHEQRGSFEIARGYHRPQHCLSLPAKGATARHPLMLVNIMEIVSEFSDPTTSHLAFITTLVNQGTSIVPHNAATVPTHVGPELMDLTFR